MIQKGYKCIPIFYSPLKVVRAKITEEVNHRLISFGVDPLSSRLPQNVFQKQRKLLQEQQEIKSKVTFLFSTYPAQVFFFQFLVLNYSQIICFRNAPHVIKWCIL